MIQQGAILYEQRVSDPGCLSGRVWPFGTIFTSEGVSGQVRICHFHRWLAHHDLIVIQIR